MIRDILVLLLYMVHNEMFPDCYQLQLSLSQLNELALSISLL